MTTRMQERRRQEVLGNFQSLLNCGWATEDAPERDLLDQALVDAVLDPRLGDLPEAVLLSSLTGAGAARNLVRAVPWVTVFDPSGLAYTDLPATRPAEQGITWAQGPSFLGLASGDFDVVVIDHLAMLMFPDEIPRLLSAVRHAVAPGGMMLLVNGREPLPGWWFEAESLRVGLSATLGEPIHEEDLGEDVLGIWRV